MHDGDFAFMRSSERSRKKGLMHGGEHALVGDGACGQGREVDAHLVFDALADAEGVAVQFDARGELVFGVGTTSVLNVACWRALRSSPSGLVG